MTPMTSWLSPLIVSERPITARSPPKRRIHRPWLSSTTRGALGTSSSSR
jgi:hypothetical protein